MCRGNLKTRNRETPRDKTEKSIGIGGTHRHGERPGPNPTPVTSWISCFKFHLEQEPQEFKTRDPRNE